jgi:hypothetical protein
MLMNLIYLLVGALLALGGVMLPGCDDGDDYSMVEGTETDTGAEQLTDRTRNTGDDLQDDTGTGDALQDDSDTGTGDALQDDSDTGTGDALQDDTGTGDALQDDTDTGTDIEIPTDATQDNCEAMETFLEKCKPASLPAFKDSCNPSHMTGYAFCVFECANKPIDDCAIDSTPFNCGGDICEHYENCMQLCPR